MVSSEEKYITTSDNSYYLGPIIYSIGVQDGTVFGENAKVESDRHSNVSGFFILAGKKRAYTGLSRQEFESIATNIGLSNVELKDGPSALFKSGEYAQCR